MPTLRAPASKSVSHRMLIAASLSRGVSLVRRVLSSDDLDRTRAILRKAGAEMEDLGGDWSVRGMAHGPVGGPLDGTAPPLDCFVHESGTTCRLLSAVLAAGRGSFRIHGAGRMHERPVGALTDALASLGAAIEFEGRAGFPPFVLRSQGLRGGDAELCADASSQYLSGLLLAAPLCSGPLRITLTGRRVVSWPYAALTLQVLEDFGIGFSTERLEGGEWKAVPWKTLRAVKPREFRITVRPGAYRAGEYTVEGDWSGASYLLAAGAVGRAPVVVTGLRADSVQGDRAILDILRAMGASVSESRDGFLVCPSRLRGISWDMGDCPDLVPTVAMAAALAEGTTRLTNIAHLRLKECDRLSACAAELGRIGVRTEEGDDSLTIFGAGPNRPALPSGTVFHAHNDHRLAMSCALLSLAAGCPPAVDDPSVVRKSFPDFWDAWAALP